MKYKNNRSVTKFRTNSFITVIMAALLLGFAWQIRGSGTSDPAVVALLFMLFLTVVLGPRKKFNLPLFGLIAYSFNVMRTGWGTFIPQAGIPGLISGYLPPDVTIAVPWWYGYFWLFVVGISWMGIPSLLFGGYFFTKQRYNLKDVVIIGALFLITEYLAHFIVEPLIPTLAPEYYKGIYLTGISERSYGSMIGNMSTAMAIIPVLLYILYVKKDKNMFKHSLVAMLIFAFSLSVAIVWRPLSLLTGIGKYDGWSLWEYFSGFFFGGLIFWYYLRIKDKELKETDIPFDLNYDKWHPVFRFILFAWAFYRFVLHGIGESLGGVFRLSYRSLELENPPSEGTLMLIVVIAGSILYALYYFGKIGTSFLKRSLREKSLLTLITLLPFYYLFLAMSHIIDGDLLLLRADNVAVWLDTLSFVIVEVYVIYLYRQSKVLNVQINKDA